MKRFWALPLICCGIGFVLPLINILFIGSYRLAIVHPIFDLIIGPTLGLVVGLVALAASLVVGFLLQR